MSFGIKANSQYDASEDALYKITSSAAANGLNVKCPTCGERHEKPWDQEFDHCKECLKAEKARLRRLKRAEMAKIAPISP